jgi:hypothetical protein
MRKMFALIVLMPFVSFCQEENRIKTIYPNMVGDIEFNKETDKENFELCYEKYISQYFNDSNGLEYEGGKGTIEKEFAEKYKSENIENESGLIRIRFVVNCKGETDRFRLISMDRNYNEKVFLKSITDQLLSITKNLKGWKVKKYEEKEIDYYQYLIFKIENGQLKEILP